MTGLFKDIQCHNPPSHRYSVSYIRRHPTNIATKYSYEVNIAIFPDSIDMVGPCTLLVGETWDQHDGATSGQRMV